MAAAASTTPTTTRKDETVSYEVDKTIQHTKGPIGGIKRLTAAVVVNYRKQTDDKGKATTAALSQQEMEQINSLVREAMGFNKERGDSLNIVNTAFSEPEKEIIGEPPLWKQPENIALAKETGKYLLLAGLMGYLFFGVLKPMLRDAMQARPAPELASLPSAGSAADRVGTGPTGDPLQLARKIAREDPKIVANVVKNWVTKDG